MPRKSRPRSMTRRVWVFTQITRFFISLGARTRFVTHVRVDGRPNIPKKGPVLIVCKHNSIVDFLFVFGAVRRNVAFVAAAGIFDAPVIGSVMRWMGHHPVKRGDAKAKDEMVNFAKLVMDSGGMAAIFGEGKVADPDTMLPMKGGPAEIAFATGCWCVPMGLNGTQNIKGKGRRLRFWQPVSTNIGLPMKAPYISANASLRDRIIFSNKLATEIAHLSGLEPVLTPLPDAA